MIYNCFSPIDEILIFPSLKKMKENMSFTDRTKKRRFCILLSKFLNYCDYMTINALHKILTCAFRDLAYIFEAHEQCAPTMEELTTNLFLDKEVEQTRPLHLPQLPFIQAFLTLKPDCVETSPSRSITTHHIQQLTNLIKSVIFGFERFQSDEFYNQYTA